MKNQTKNSKKTIVKFHIGRGGRFNNPGHKTFLGCEGIGESPEFEDLFYNKKEDFYYMSTGELYDSLTSEDVDSGIGIININHDYDTIYTKYIDNCDEFELAAIAEEDPYNLIELIKEANVFDNEDHIEILYELGKLKEAIEYENYIDSLYWTDILEITREEYDNEFEACEMNGKYYKKQ